MTDYFISNEAVDIGATEDTTAGRFPSHETRAMLLDVPAPHAVSLPPIQEYWISFYEYIETANKVAGLDGVIHRMDITNYPSWFGIKFTDGVPTGYLYNRSGVGTIVGNYPTDRLVRHDVHVKHDVGGVDDWQLRWYSDGTLLIDTGVSFDGVKSGLLFNSFHAGGDDYIASPDRHWVSNIIVSDVDTRNREFATFKPGAAGTYDQWIGGLAELSDNTLATHARSDAGGERTSFTFTPGADPGFTLTSVQVVADVQASGASPNPSQIAPFLRIGTVDYDGAATALNSPARQSVNVSWGTDPSDAAAWTWADLTGLEFGLLSIT